MEKASMETLQVNYFSQLRDLLRVRKGRGGLKRLIPSNLTGWMKARENEFHLSEVTVQATGHLPRTRTSQSFALCPGESGKDRGECHTRLALPSLQSPGCKGDGGREQTGGRGISC